MDVSSLQQVHQLMAEQMQNQQTVPTREDNSRFSDLFTQQLQATNQLQHEADVKLQQFMIGESESLHEVMIAMEEATLALQFTTQVRNKVIDAYQEIKNMQV